MPFCPSCQTEYRPGFTRCTDCDAELVESLPEEKPEEFPQTELELVELASFPDYSEAEMIQELLEENGIPTVLHGDVVALGNVSGAATLLVEKAALPEAQKLYEDYFAGEVEGEPEPGDDGPDEGDGPDLP